MSHTKINFDQLADQYMKYVDVNGDGFLSREELESFFDFAASKGYKYDKKLIVPSVGIEIFKVQLF